MKLSFKNQIFVTLLCVFGVTFSVFAKVPERLKPYLKEGVIVKAEAIAVIPPKELDQYLNKLEEAAKKDPEWYEAYAKEAPAGIPLPFHEKLGLTKKEYDAYLATWDKREFKVVEPIQLRLDNDSNKWVIRATGKKGAPISLLKYDPKTDTFRSPNGEMKRLADIDADKRSILGGWTGQEWKYTEQSDFVNMKENIAIGKTKDGKYGMLVYRIQEMTPEGKLLYDKSSVIRFALK